MEYSKLTKKAKKVIATVAFLQAAFFALVCGLAVMQYLGIVRIVKFVLMAVSFAAALLWAVVVPAVRFKRYKYMITPDRIEIIEGVFWVKRTVVPIDRIHQISVSHGPVDSLFGVAKVSVITAGSTAVMRFIELEKANEIAMHLNKKVNEKLGGENNVQ